MPWSSRLNAEIYDRFVREHEIYGWLNRHLIEDGRIESAEVILDLGCGTGATTLACLPRMPARASILGVDASRAMVEVARANVHDPRARFDVVPATAIGRLATKFDRVISNAAFWQFGAPERVFAALAEVTDAGSVVAFNIPTERLAGEPSTMHSVQVALQRAIGEMHPGGAVRDDPVVADELLGAAASRGFVAEERLQRAWSGTQGELVELMSIPAMIGRVAVGLSESERETVLARVRNRVDPDEPVRVGWTTFVLRRGATDPSSSESVPD